ncbi:MAG: hypothetical protein RBU28_05320 [Bacteroidales bacterium]|jgi:hypothetical protein|nr:hypothetical protein [Bacteroidales bacterium]
MKRYNSKNQVFILSVISVVFLIAASGCRKEVDDQLFLEISHGGGRTVLQKELEGIDFKFCLLDDEGDSTTVINENENFTLSFSFKNNNSDTIIVTTGFINDDFYRIFKSDDNQDMEKPWTGVWCDYSGYPREIKLAPFSYKSFNCPWVLTESSLPEYPLCMGESRPYLPKGEYYTRVKLGFRFTINKEEYFIDNTVLRINFLVN